MDNIPSDIRNELDQRIPGLSLHLFGSRFTGLHNELSDWDFVHVFFLDPEQSPLSMESQILKRQDIFREAGFDIMLGYTPEQMTKCSSGFDSTLNPGLLFVAKLRAPVKLDILVMTVEEAERRFDTLKAIRALVRRGNPHIGPMMAKFKGDHQAYAGLHALVAQVRGGQ